MFDDFLQKHPDVCISVETYSRLLKTSNIFLKLPVSVACPTSERYSEKVNDIDVDDEELSNPQLNSSRKDEWLLHIGIARNGKPTQKHQENASKKLES